MRRNGGIIGPRNLPTASVASGVWTLEDALIYRRAGIWPFSKASVFYTDKGESSSSLSEYSFAGRNTGTAASDRNLVVPVDYRYNSGAGSVTISGVTVGGVSATPLGTPASDYGTSGYVCALYIVALPSGASADVVVTLSGSAVRCGVGLLAAYGLNSTTPVDYDTSISTAPSVSLDVSEGGVVIGAAIFAGSTAARSASWTNLTEAYDATVTGFTSHTGASAAFSAAATPTITVTASGALESGGSAGAFVSLR